MLERIRLLGHIRDTAPHPLAIPIARLLGAGVAIPDSIELPAEIDLQKGQDCTGSYGKSVETWCAARGIPCAPISRRFTYTLGREITMANPSAVLVDDGAIPADVVEGMRVFGVVPESAFPGDDANVINERIAFGTLEASWRVTDIAAIAEVGEARVQAVRAALAHLYPVPYGQQIDDAYAYLANGAVYSGPKGKITGGHAQRIVGYRPGPTPGSWVFKVAGSWGTDFADAGFAWIDGSVIGNPELCYDLYALHVAPTVSS